jgi:hypothetical protein
MNIIKPTANQISITTPGNTVYNAAIVFISATSASVVNVVSNTGVTTGTFTIPANQYIYVQKLPTDLISASVAVFATPAAYRG